MNDESNVKLFQDVSGALLAIDAVFTAIMSETKTPYQRSVVLLSVISTLLMNIPEDEWDTMRAVIINSKAPASSSKTLECARLAFQTFEMIRQKTLNRKPGEGIYDVRTMSESS